ncbi:TldD/PmbA family protein [Spiractinospora alimapuensis]|uniref:metallopeptidase TldD-related protein n=1 Tax=Spiractinospora alimapuensis TaxID=2820884 RepID=UPI0037431546|nr:TldD/PmbA family protein [Spiractinospora alimapuensis]
MVLVSETSSANLRWANNTLTTNGVTRGRTVTVIALTHGPQGTAAGVVSRTGAPDDALAELVASAEAVSREAAPAEEARPLLTPEDAASGDFTSEAPVTDMSVLRDVADGLGEAFGRARSTGQLLYGYAEHDLTTTYLGTSTGVRLCHSQPTGTIELNAKKPEFASSTWVGQSTRDFGDVDVLALAAETDRRTQWASRTMDLPAGRYETLMPPSTVGDMMIDLYQAMGARDAEEGRTVFSRPNGATSVGERLAHLPVTLRSDPAEPGLECAPFLATERTGRTVTAFDNGLPLRPTRWIDQGTVGALGQTRHSADLTGQPVTGFVDNLVLEHHGATRTLDDMIADTRRGLLLTCLWYIRVVDPQTLLLTGLTRDGVYLVEDGEIVGAVNNFRFNESPASLLERATEAGVTVPALSRETGDYFSRTAMPALRVPDFNMSSVSQAS